MSDESPSTGIVFAATGKERYIELAVRAAETVRRHNPGRAIDLFTDKPRSFSVFDQIHVRSDAWFRTKIDALMASRFERTLYLDADMVVLADLSDVFDVLERFDIALTHDQFRNQSLCHILYQKPLPAAFPQFNGGMIALRRNAQTQTFLTNWKAATIAHGIGRDQPSLRELLWDGDLRIATLPPEYNLMDYDSMASWSRAHPAPRLIHSPHFSHRFESFRNSPDPVTDLLGLRLGSRVGPLLADDRDLAVRAGHPLPPLRIADRRPDLTARLHRWGWIARRAPRRIALALMRRIRSRLAKAPEAGAGEAGSAGPK